MKNPNKIAGPFSFHNFDDNPLLLGDGNFNVDDLTARARGSSEPLPLATFGPVAFEASEENARPFSVAALDRSAKLTHSPIPAPAATDGMGVATASLSINDTADHVINATESSAVAFTVSGLGGNQSGTVTFSDASNHQVSVDVGANGTFSADLSTLTDGTITSLLSATDAAGHAATATGNTVSLDTDSALTPAVVVDAGDPAHVTFTISGLEGDETGTMTFTDTLGHSDVINIGSNGTYGADLSNLANGTLTYLVSVTDPAGNVTNFDPTVTLGDGSANAPAGTPEFATLLNSYTLRPSWYVAGVDYYVGTPSGTVLKNPTSISMAGVSVDSSNHVVTVSGSNVTLNGYDFSLNGGWGIVVTNLATNVTIENSNFKVGANNLIPIDATLAGSVNVLYNTFDGGGTQGHDPNQMIGVGGLATIEYNHFTNIANDVIDFENVPGGAAVQGGTVQYNLADSINIGTYHSDFVQTYAAGGGSGNQTINSLIVQYNTYYEPPSWAGANTGGDNSMVRIGDQGNGIVSGVVAAYNTFLFPNNPTGSNIASIFQWGGGNGSNTLQNSVIHDNYFDPTEVLYESISTYIQSTVNPETWNNYNMVTGKLVINGPNELQNPGGPANPPSAPVITANSIVNTNHAQLTGTAPANDKIAVFDQGVLLGTTTANASGAWSFTTGVLSNGSHSLTARATDAYANTSAASLVSNATIGTTSGPGVPTIASFSTDSGTVGDGITNDNTLTLTGTAVASSTVKVYDGATLLGSATADASGAWSYTTAALANGSHSFTATDTVSGTTSAASSALSVTVDTVAPTAPVISGNAVSPSNVVTLTGTAEANSTVTVLDGTTQLGTATANASGAWSFATAALAAGNHSFTAKDTDAAGNISAVSSTLNLTLTAAVSPDLVAQTTSWSNLAFPAQTTNFTASFDAAPGQSGEDIVIGLAAANAAAFTDLAAVVRFNSTNTIDVRNGSGYGADVSVPYNAGTSYHFRMVVNLSAHTYSVYVTPQGGSEIALATNYAFRTEQATDTSLSDIGGFGTSGSASVFNFSIAGALPGAPTIASFSTDSGTAGDHITNDSTPTLTGTAVANSTVTLFDGSTQIGTTTANASGAWSYTTAALANGAHSLTATATVSGSTSTASSALSVTIDTTAPVAPGIASFSTDSGVVGDAITNDATLTLTGTAEANSTVKIYDGATLLGSATANGSGAWSYTTAALANGAHSLTATATDAAGNTGVASAAMSVTIDTTAPVAPSIVSFSTDSGTAGDAITNDATLTLTGTAEANATVKVFDGATLLGSAIANGSGAWSYTTAALANGAHSLTATATDAAGNTGVASAAMSVTIDTTVPVAPSIASFSTDSGVVGDHITNDATVTLTGTAEANSTVKIYDGATLLGSIVANGSGAWSYTTAALANGAHSLTATATDAAGNTGVASAAMSVTIDTTAPVAPSIASFSTDSGVVGDHITNDATPTLTGTAEANATVKVYDGTTLLGSAAANGSGAWSYTTAALANGAHSFTATATDAAGNTGVASAALAVTVDTIAPNAPVVLSDVVVNTNKVLLTGTAEAGSTVNIFEGAALLGTAAANGSGVWSYTTNPLADGAHNFTTTSIDAAGNTSVASQYVDPIIGTGTVIDSSGATGLSEIANHYYLLDAANTGVSLKYGGSDYVDGQFGAWTPIGAEKNATGYEIAWKNGNADQYTIWNVDSNGNYLVNVVGAVSGTNSTIEALEQIFHQDLNGDGVIGVPATGAVIESAGVTSLTEVGTTYFLNDSITGVGPSLKYASVNYTPGEFGAWTPTGAEKVGSGYEIAWKNGSADQYTVWNVDSNGNYISNVFGAVSGASTVLQSFEATFHQDINGDGVIGIASAVIESAGATSLTEVGTTFFLDDSSTGVGPSLKYANVNFTPGEFGAWTPTGAEQTANGYEIAWKNGSADQYTVWNVDSNGNYISNVFGAVSGASMPSFETSFLQDLNGDGKIGSSLVVNGASGGGTVTSTAANEVFFGNGGDNTFVFSGTTWGTDIVADFHPAADIVQLSQAAFANFATVLSHAAQVGTDVVITADATDSVTLKNTLLTQLTTSNIHIV